MIRLSYSKQENEMEMKDMERNSILGNVLTIVGFVVVMSLLMKILGGLLGFTLHILIPMALVVWLVRFIFFGNRRNHTQYYR